VTLALEIDEDSDPILRFERVREDGGIVEGIGDAFAGGTPTRVLVPRPASLTQSSREELVDIRAAVSIDLDHTCHCLV
jgi:2-methylaconitate cis-trans-isomerase PrpF